MIVGRYVLFFIFVSFVLAGSASGYYWYTNHAAQSAAVAATYKTIEENDVYTRFVMEGYDIIQANYWQKAPDSDLSVVFLAAVQKFASSTIALTTNDRAGVAKLVQSAIQEIPEADRVKTSETILGAVLYNIAPIGRNQLMTSTARADLHNEINNINPSKDLYADLGLPKGAPEEKVEEAYVEKKKELAASSSPEAQKELTKISYAKEVLSDTDKKTNYDTAGVEPTVFSHLASPSTLYVYISQMSPATESEFEHIVRDRVKDGVTSMILDVRGNVGGDLTTSLTFLGLFSGPNQYAYDFFQHGEYKAQRTLGLGAMPELKKIREIAILTDGMSQSTAEVITAAMKRLNLAASVGSKTRGWGSIEGQFPMQTQIDPQGQHQILLVVALTVRDDTQPIEGQGVMPDVDISQNNWKQQLSQHFFSADLIAAIKKQIAIPPQK